MVISEPKDFHEAFKPLVYLNCLTGIGVFRQLNQSNSTLIYMILYTVIITLITWIMIYITLKSITEVINTENISSTAVTMRKTLVSANACFTMIIPVLVWLRSEKLTECLRQISIVDKTFKAVLGDPKMYRRQSIRIACLVIAMFSLAILIIVLDLLPNLEIVSQMDNRSALVFFTAVYVIHHPIPILILLDVNFCTFVGYVGTKFRNLNDNLLQLKEKPTSCSGDGLFITSGITLENEVKDRKANDLLNNKHYLFQEARKAHLELCKLSRKINIAFGIQNLLSLGMSFVVITGLLYTIYSALSWEYFTTSKIMEVTSSMLWIAIYIYKIWTVNHSCWSVSNEAEKTGEVIYELLNSIVDEKLTREIQEFGTQMLQNPVRFTACGFFTLDYSFVQGVIGSITTYLVILIQMSNVSASPTFKPPLAMNSTELPVN